MAETMSRPLDIVISLFAVLILFPFFLVISLAISLDSKGGVIYRQRRVGMNGRDFFMFKFRTMVRDADREGLLSTGRKDERITRVGSFLRNYKLDELPQLVNIIRGEMSIVGPRPEVRKYVDLYTNEELQVLKVRPGLTDYASLAYLNEGDMLAASDDPEKLYIETIMPAKLALNLKYIREKSLRNDLGIILKTVGRILGAA